MPDVALEKQPTLDLLDSGKPALSTTSDMPIIETTPDVVVAKPAAADKAEPVESATTEPTESASAEPDKQAKKPAQGVQKRIDELTRQREDERRAREKSEAMLAEALATLKGLAVQRPVEKAEQPLDDPEPKEPEVAKYTDQETYNKDYREYLRGLARWEGRQEVKAAAKREAESRQKQTDEERSRKVVSTYQERVAKAREKYPDYDAVAHGQHWTPTKVMADAIMEHDLGTDIAHYLGANPAEASRIAQLSPHGQLMELGLIGAQFRQTSAQQKPGISKAPAPIKPLSTASASAATVSGDEESMEAYAARRKKELQSEGRHGARR